ncbi:CHAD domain-containing protein [Malonomonas rubra DSM 5091]|uniref:CHAD domain-containing protein n=1 Tax=Malonomonas rubra DSM 5091 TaxID=1122189 RepID=A0A1M6GHE7_MALRU|nr:CHAD domain-containing protein [Malonomonas rubra]SHJ09384.1 CHAD domain-containing protein [Malonomonas rubra DSM 5091]
MTSATYWKFTTAVTPAEIEQALPKKLRCRVLEKSSRGLIVLDDFHWHIWQSGGLLTADPQQGLLNLSIAKEIPTVPYSPENRFWWQLPSGALSDHLRELLDLHAFVPKAECRLISEPLAIINSDEKIVTRVKLLTLNGENLPSSTFAEISPLRGYGDDYTVTLQALSLLSSVEVESFDLRTLLLAGGLHIDPPDEKDSFLLNPAEPAEAAICKMAKRMLVTARQYEQGIVEDIDTEFVHQYRVNIRKSRSLISLFKKTLSSERLQALKTELKVLGSRTNDLRDLDVFLLDEDYYREMLPAELQTGMTQVFTRIKRRRTMALKKVVASLQDDAYQAEVDHLFELFDTEPDWLSKQSQMPIQQLVAKKVLAQYQRICANGDIIDEQTPDEAVHDLRIECKKLRYLLELFSELFGKKKVKQLIRHLKGLQDNLGRFNDFSVQREFLSGLGIGKTISAEQLASINGLTAVLFNKQLHERSLVVANIDKFTAPGVRDEFQQIFALSDEESS